MKRRVFKIMLSLLVILSGITVTTSMTATPVIARTVGDYTYTDNSDGTVTITNYGGSERNLTIPEELDGKTVSAIGYAAFAECRSLESVVVPETVTRLQDYAFSQCTSLSSIELPESIVSLGRGIFKNCILLEDVNIPASLTTVAQEMFAGCTSLSEITIPQSIRSIGDSAFSGCSGLTQITLPDNVTTIGSASFRSCVNLEQIELSDRITTIGNNAFAECYELGSITLPQTLRQIGQSAFLNCIGLQEITLPESIKNLGYSVFSGCSSLSEVNLPANLDAIPDSAFSACSSLQHIELPESITSVGASAFAACIALSDIELPESVTTIGSGIFNDCDSLVSVELPEDLEMIPSEAFRYCDNLKKVIVPTGVSEVGNNAFADCPSLETVFLPSTIARDKFGSTVFYNSPNVVLYVVNGSGAYSYAVNFRLNYVILSDEITMEADEITMQVGENREMTVMRRSYAVVNNASLTWTSTDDEVASVENGVITAKSGGDAVITAELPDGAQAKVTVHVDDRELPITAIELSETELEMDVNTRKGLKATIVPSNTTDNKILSWESEDPTIAIVSATGNVTAKGPGTTTITVRAENGVSASCEVTVNSPITSVRLSQTQMTLEAGTSQQLRTMIEPVNTTDDTTLTWMSTVPSVATVDQEGNVTAVSEGYAIIRVKTVNGISTTCRVEVVETQEVPITGVSLDQESMTLTEGESGTLNATIIPGDTTDDRTLTWSSDAPEVAVVNDGEITAIAPGTATITVTTSNGKSDSCIVTVERREIEIISVSLDHSELTMKAGRETTLNATINPADTTMSKELSWSTSNAEVATVEDGVVRAVAEGDAVISVTTVNGKRAECVVHVFEVSLDALNDTIARAEQLDDEESYTLSSYAAFTQALEEARATAADEEALQADVDAAQQKLESAIAGLIERADSATMERLAELAAAGSELEGSYSEEEFAEMKAAIETAETLLEKDAAEVSEAEATAAVSALEEAGNGLKVLDAQKALAEAITDAQEILSGDVSIYEPAGVDALRNAVSAAQAVLESGTEDIETLNDAADSVRQAISELKVQEPEAADKSFLQLFYDAVKGTGSEGYTAESYEAFAAALEEAAAVLDDDAASQEDVDAAAEALIRAYSELEREAQTDYSGLDFEIEYAKSMLENEGEYYESDMNAVREVLAEAEALREEAAGQDEVDQMVKAMRELRLSIRKRPQ